jgi:hypothetical protein
MRGLAIELVAIGLIALARLRHAAQCKGRAS